MQVTWGHQLFVAHQLLAQKIWQGKIFCSEIDKEINNYT